jgi:hypothetical protein
METSKRQISMFGEDELTSLQADSHVSPIQLQEKGLARRMSATSGQRCLEQFEKFNRPGLWAKTFSALLIGTGDWFSTRCKLTWRLRGTKYNRLYFQLVPSTLPIEEIEFGLLLTATTREEVQDLEKFKKRMEKYPNGTTMPNLATQVMSLLPTPTATSDAKGGCTRTDPTRQNDSLANAIHGQIGDIGKTSQLNPQFVLEMMGFNPDWTLLPFLNGETNPSKQEVTQ